MKKNRVLARTLADELKDDVLGAIAGGCNGATCTANGPDGLPIIIIIGGE